MTELETAMGMIINVFSRYAAIEGSKKNLTKSELKTLMEKELPGFLQDPGGNVGFKGGRDNDTVDKLLKDLDANGDAEVDFNEFVVFVAALTTACHSFFVQA